MLDLSEMRMEEEESRRRERRKIGRKEEEEEDRERGGGELRRRIGGRETWKKGKINVGKTDKKKRDRRKYIIKIERDI